VSGEQIEGQSANNPTDLELKAQADPHSGSFVRSLPDGSRVLYSHDGVPVRQWNPDGSTVTYNAQGNPVSGTTADGATLTYGSDGHVTAAVLPDKSVETIANDKVVQVLRPDGTRLTDFDAQGRPTGGVTAGNQPFTISYGNDGWSEEHLAGGVIERFDADGHLVQLETPDGTVLADFDADERPHSGRLSDGTRFTISYVANGDSIESFANGTRTEFGPDHKPIRTWTPEGTEFTAFDDLGRPTAGVRAGGEPFTLSYDSDGTVEELSSGGTVWSDANGHVFQEKTPDGTIFADFDAAGRPHSGQLSDGTKFTISYAANGDVIQGFGDGTRTEFGPDGKPIKTWTADGTEITWAVDIPALNSAISRASAQRDLLHQEIRSFRLALSDISAEWSSPAGGTLDPLLKSFNSVIDKLTALLDDAIDNRMQTAYRNYVNTEQTNVGNLH
jgi:YD repeat-containing protein